MQPFYYSKMKGDIIEFQRYFRAAKFTIPTETANAHTFKV